MISAQAKLLDFRGCSIPRDRLNMFEHNMEEQSRTGGGGGAAQTLLGAPPTLVDAAWTLLGAPPMLVDAAWVLLGAPSTLLVRGHGGVRGCRRPGRHGGVRGCRLPASQLLLAASWTLLDVPWTLLDAPWTLPRRSRRLPRTSSWGEQPIQSKLRGGVAQENAIKLGLADYGPQDRLYRGRKFHSLMQVRMQH